MQNRRKRRPLQPYVQQIAQWTKDNDVILDAGKTIATLFNSDLAEYNTLLNLTIDQTQLPIEKYSKTLELSFDPKLNFNRHISTSTESAKWTIRVLKALMATFFSKDQKTLTLTHKTITRPILEYARTI